MAERDDGFLNRWSRRKRDPEAEPDPTAEPEEAKPSGAVVPASPDDPERDEEAGDPEVIAKLPDIESLKEESDFTPFMAEGVPEILRRRALRKLWRLNPVFANLDGLAEYDEDYTDAANLLSEIKTVYKVGKGMVDREAARKTAKKSAEEPAEESAEEAAEEAAASENAADPAPAESPEDSSAEPKADPSANRIAPVDEVQPVPVAEAAPPPEEEDGEASEAALRKPAEPQQRSAAARRWGESSE